MQSQLFFIKNDPQIISTYQKIAQEELKRGGYALHDLNHVNNVAQIVQQILQMLACETDLIEEAQIAAILHDIGILSEGKKNHAYRSYIAAKKYFDENQIKLKYGPQVLEAIKNHSDVADDPSLISLVLLLGDKLDIKQGRITPAGRELIGNRQFDHIKDIRIDIKNQKIILDFICDKKIDLQELGNYYFMKKVFKAIRAFATFTHLEPIVLLNSHPWDLFLCFDPSQSVA